MKNNENLIDRFLKSKEKLICKKIKGFIKINEEVFIDIYGDFVDELNNIDESNYQSLFEIRYIESNVTNSENDSLSILYIIKKGLPVSFMIKVTANAQELSNFPVDKHISFDSFFGSEINSFERTILYALIENYNSGFYETEGSAFYNACKNTFKNSKYYNFFMYYKYITEKKIAGAIIDLPKINPKSIMNIKVLGNLYFNLLSSQDSLKRIRELFEKKDYISALAEIESISFDIILSSGDYFINQFTRYKKYYYTFSGYFWNLFDNLKKLRIKTSLMTNYFDSVVGEKISYISLIDQFIESEKLLNNILFYSSLLLIYISPFYKRRWRFYSYSLFKKLTYLLEDCSIQKIVSQEKPLKEVPPEERTSKDGTTRLQLFFRLEGNYDVYMLRIDLPHQGVPFIHINLEESLRGSMTSSGIPVDSEIEEIIDKNCLKFFFYKCANKYWFKTNFEKNYKDYDGAYKKIINEVFESQSHLNIYITDEKEFNNFISEIVSIMRLYCSKSFTEIPFDNEKINNSNFLGEIRLKDSIILDFNKLFKDAGSLDEINITEEVCDKIIELLVNFY